MNRLNIQFFNEAYDFINDMPELDRAKVLANIKMMETDFDIVHTKLLRSPIKELIIKKYRLLFYTKENTIYFTHGFLKKSQKTPIKEIEKAESVYKMMK